MDPVTALYLRWVAQVVAVAAIAFFALARKRPDWSPGRRLLIGVVAGVMVLLMTSRFSLPTSFGRRLHLDPSALKKELRAAEASSASQQVFREREEDDFTRAQDSDDPYLAIRLGKHGQRRFDEGDHESAARFFGRSLQMLEAKAAGERLWNYDSYILQYVDNHVTALRETDQYDEAARVELLAAELRATHADKLQAGVE